MKSEIGPIIAYPLKLLFERSLEIGQLPADWKYSTITAIYKKGPTSDVGNYRPVSILMFIMFINDITEVCSNNEAHIYLFADDAKLCRHQCDTQGTGIHYTGS